MSAFRISGYEISQCNGAHGSTSLSADCSQPPNLDSVIRCAAAVFRVVPR